MNDCLRIFIFNVVCVLSFAAPEINLIRNEFAQGKKCEKYPWRSITFSKVVKLLC